jgi:hypothetical protein
MPPSLDFFEAISKSSLFKLACSVMSASNLSIRARRPTAAILQAIQPYPEWPASQAAKPRPTGLRRTRWYEEKEAARRPPPE